MSKRIPLTTTRIAPEAALWFTLPICNSCGAHVRAAYRHNSKEPAVFELAWHCSGCQKLLPALASEDLQGINWLHCALAQQAIINVPRFPVWGDDDEVPDL